MTRRGSPAGLAAALAAAAAFSACDLPVDPGPAPALPPNSLAFGVFGDGPYHPWENGRWHRVLADVARTPDLAWLLHVGDLFWYPCSDDRLAERAAELAAVPHPVIYTPGDNEWTDCHDPRAGGYAPLDRLAAIRRILFADPAHSLGSPALELETQSSDPAWADFVENARWRRGRFVFATVHVVGSRNGMEPFAGRTAASDAESARRMQAALAWIDRTFDAAEAEGAKGVVIAFHAEIGLIPTYDSREGYEPLVADLENHARTFPGEILVIHGDSHQFRSDHPFADTAGKPIERFTRLETYGSPDIGWLRVVVDTVQGKLVRFEPRKMRGWW